MAYNRKDAGGEGRCGMAGQCCTSVSLRVFGKFALCRDDREIAVGGAKTRALLAYLACQAGKPQSRDRLIGLLWGDRFETQARQSLRHTLSELRKTLGADVFEVDRDRVCLTAAFQSDVAQFKRLLSSGEPDGCRAAIALYQDELLADASLREKPFMDWLATERARLRDLAVSALDELIDSAAESLTPQERLSLAQRAVTLDPYREPAHRQLLQALADLGRRNDAVAHYRQLERALRAELGVEPEPATRALLESLCAAPTIDARGAAPLNRFPTDADVKARLPWSRRQHGVAITEQWRNAATPNRDRPSIAVLPFFNMSKDQDYLADGISEDLITDLAKISGLFVISRNSTFVYKGKAVVPAEVADTLGVRYLLEGSVRREGDHLRVNAQLIDTATNSHLWAERYDYTMTDVFALQDDITRSIVAALQVELSEGDQSRVAETTDIRAYDAFLQGWERYRRNTPQDHAEAIPHFERAIALDPSYGRAHAALALVYYDIVDSSWSGQLGFTDKLVLERSRQQLDQAMQHPTSTAHLLQGEWLRVAGRFDEAVAESERAITLDPSDSLALANLSNILTAAGRAQKGLDAIKSAVRIDPHYPALYLHYLAKAQFGLGEYTDAAANWERATTRNPESTWWFVFLASAYGHLGRLSDAKNAIGKADAGFASWTHTTVLLASVLAYKDRNDLERLLDGLRKAGVPELPFDFDERAPDRLGGDAIRALLFGHTARGSYATGEAFEVKRTADGVVTEILPDGSETGRSVVEDDRLCNLYPISGRSCGAVFRNPTGSATQHDEYIFISPCCEATFSVVE